MRKYFLPWAMKSYTQSSWSIFVRMFSCICQYVGEWVCGCLFFAVLISWKNIALKHGTCNQLGFQNPRTTSVQWKREKKYIFNQEFNKTPINGLFSNVSQINTDETLYGMVCEPQPKGNIQLTYTHTKKRHTMKIYQNVKQFRTEAYCTYEY